jgi:ABC-type branched-subunit amino acid transport system substrate-binding protein
MSFLSLSSLPLSNLPLAHAVRSVCAMACVAAIGGLGGCQTTRTVHRPAPPKPAVQQTVAPQQMRAQSQQYLTLPGMGQTHVPVRVGLMLPFSNGSAATRGLADAMLNAAELAVSDAGNPDILLMPADAGATPADSAAAVQKLLDNGAEIIVGPLFSRTVRAVAPLAKASGVPVLAFSTDRTTAGNGVYLLSFQPENEVRAIVSYAASQGHTHFAALIPQTPYGDRVATAFRAAVDAVHGILADMERFDPQSGNAVEQAAAMARSHPDAVLIAQGGALLRGMAPTLVVAGLSPDRVKFLGTGLWDDPAITREPTLDGGWFAAPAPDVQDAFDAKYRTVFDGTPPQLATLAYDAMSLVALLSNGAPYHRFTPAALTDPNGFSGVDGIFRFRPDGTAERGLAILRVTPQGFQVQRPAPKTFQPMGE